MELGDLTSRYRGRRVLVTGAAGLVGSWLSRRLVDAGATVVAFDIAHGPGSELHRSGTASRVVVVAGDVVDGRAVERAVVDHEVDTVFHLAAQAIVGAARRAPQLTLETNVQGTWNVLETCRRQRALVSRIVVASSDKAYGDHGTEPYDESTPLEGREPYEVSKSCADLIAQSYGSSYGLPVAIARCGNIYGGGDRNWSRLVPGALAALLHGERFVIRSDGSLLRDYLYVGDVVDAYLMLGDAAGACFEPGEACNFGEDRARSVLELYAAVAKAVGRTDLEPIVLGEAPGELAAQHLRSDRAARKLGWRPAHDLEAALAETAAWYRDFFDGGGVRS